MLQILFCVENAKPCPPRSETRGSSNKTNAIQTMYYHRLNGVCILSKEYNPTGLVLIYSFQSISLEG